MYLRENVMSIFRLRLVCLTVGAAATASQAALTHAQPASGATLRIEQLSADPLPYQAVRVRVSLKYESEGILTNVPEFGTRLFIASEKSRLHQIRDASLLPMSELSYVWGCEGDDHDHEFQLCRGEELSCSYPLSLVRLNDVNPDSWTQLFSQPGKYTLQEEYEIPRQKDYGGYLRRATKVITVREPTGDDKIVYEMLKNNKELAHELALPIHDPLDTVYDQIREIVEKYPESSYANYARFALARRHLYGTGFPQWERVPRGGELAKRDQYKAHVGEYLKKIEPGVDIEALAREFCSGMGRGISGKRLQEVRDVLAAAQDPSKSDASVELLTEMLWVSPQDRRAAQRLLLGILDKDFAYYPNVLASLKMSLLGSDPEWEKRIDAEMNEKHYDASVWLCLRRLEIRERRPWRDFRVRYVPKK